MSSTDGATWLETLSYTRDVKHGANKCPPNNAVTWPGGVRATRVLQECTDCVKNYSAPLSTKLKQAISEEWRGVRCRRNSPIRVWVNCYMTFPTCCSACSEHIVN